ncbi:hypothetical protein ACIPL1_15000 [Pseudomonas sp. NPDC090202]|uniref:hypothetical protein n=1 Tax=unclassified Pseudomonas TaxID=196821 RepID=UPI0038289147
MTKPYVFINDRMQTFSSLKNKLDGNDKFDQLNAHIYNIVVMPGQFVIVGDHSTRTLSVEETELMQLAQQVKRQTAFNQVGPESLAIKNYDLLQNMLNYGSLGIGAATGSWSTHLEGVKKTLEDIERLYKLALSRGTPIARQEFISQRQVLFGKLDKQLEGIARWGTGMNNTGSIKKMLGVSTKSYLHTGEIQGYAKKIGGVAKAAKLLKHGTAVGIGLNIAATGLEIKEACSTGRENQCEKAKYVELGKLSIGVTGAMIIGDIGAAAASGICMAVFSVPTGGLAILGCGIIGGVIGGYGGGLAGEKIGEYGGTMLYDWRKN